MTAGIPEGFTLEPLETRHLDEVFALYTDHRVWMHLPSGRHVDPPRTAAMIEHAERSRVAAGLGPWAVLEVTSGRLAGTAGVGWTDLGVWNLGYRFHPDFQGRGLAGAVARHAIERAHETAPDAPVIARMLDVNTASVRLAVRLGLHHVWQGGTPAADGAAHERHVFADRALPPDTLAALIALG